MSAQPGMDRRYTAGAPDGNAGLPGQEASVGSLLRELAHEASAMVGNEVALAKSEARETLHTTGRGVAAVASGGAVAFSGFIVLLMSAVYGLSNVMEPWLAALIVGGVVLVIGALLVQSGKRKFRSENLRPEHSLNTMRKNTDAIRGRTA
jgi:hypothetical protein